MKKLAKCIQHREFKALMHKYFKNKVKKAKNKIILNLWKVISNLKKNIMININKIQTKSPLF